MFPASSACGKMWAPGGHQHHCSMLVQDSQQAADSVQTPRLTHPRGADSEPGIFAASALSGGTEEASDLFGVLNRNVTMMQNHTGTTKNKLKLYKVVLSLPRGILRIMWLISLLSFSDEKTETQESWAVSKVMKQKRQDSGEHLYRLTILPPDTTAPPAPRLGHHEMDTMCSQAESHRCQELFYSLYFLKYAVECFLDPLHIENKISK